MLSVIYNLNVLIFFKKLNINSPQYIKYGKYSNVDFFNEVYSTFFDFGWMKQTLTLHAQFLQFSGSTHSSWSLYTSPLAVQVLSQWQPSSWVSLDSA